MEGTKRSHFDPDFLSGKELLKYFVNIQMELVPTATVMLVTRYVGNYVGDF